MPLQLVLGPANCGKIALLLDRFLEAADAGADPFLIVPNRPDVEAGPLVGHVQRRLLLADVVSGTPLHALAASARFSGFEDAVGALADELSAAMEEPRPAADSARAQELSALVAAYRAAVDGIGMHDRPGRRAVAAGLLEGRLGAWDDRP